MTTELATRFVDDGYVVIDDLVNSADVAAICADAERFSDGSYAVANRPDDGRLLAVHFPHWVSPVALDAVRHQGIADVLAQITGAHLAHWDGSVKCMQSMLFFKPPGLPGQAWHQDERFIPTRDRSLVGAWIALDDATIDNGCLWVHPGSHRRGMLYPHRPHGNPDEWDPTAESFGFDDEFPESAAVPVEVRSGAVVFFNGYLLHKSMRNRSDRTRRALVNHYMSATSNLPWMVHRGIDVATEDHRVVVPVVGEDPLAWKGYAPPPEQVFVRPAQGEWSIPKR